MGWLAPRHRQWLCAMRKWLRVLSMDNSFLTKKMFLHSMNQSNSSCRTLFYRVKQFLFSIDQEHLFHARDLNARLVLPVIDANFKMFYDKCWQEKLQAEFAVRCGTHDGTYLGRIEHLKTHTALNHMFALLHKRNSDQRMPNLDVELHQLTLNYVDMD